MLEQFQTNDYSFETIQQLNDSLQYIDYINSNYNFKETNIEPDLAYRYTGNFFGLLKVLNVSTNLYLFTLYINGLNHPGDFKGDLYTIKIAHKPPIPIS